MIEQTCLCVSVCLFVCVQVLPADGAQLNATRRGTENLPRTRSSECYFFSPKAEGTNFWNNNERGWSLGGVSAAAENHFSVSSKTADLQQVGV